MIYNIDFKCFKYLINNRYEICNTQLHLRQLKKNG